MSSRHEATKDLYIHPRFSCLRLIDETDNNGNSDGALVVLGGGCVAKNFKMGSGLVQNDLIVLGNIIGTIAGSTGKVFCVNNIPSPDDTTADGSGYAVASDPTRAKTMIWYDALDSWHFNQDINLGTGMLTTGDCTDSALSGSAYRIDGDIVLDPTSLGPGIIQSSLTEVGILDTGAINIEKSIITITSGTPTTITTSTPHGYSTGQNVLISGSDSTPSIDGCHTVTVTSSTMFTIPMGTTIGGITGSVVGETFPINIGLSQLDVGDIVVHCGKTIELKDSSETTTITIDPEIGTVTGDIISCGSSTFKGITDFTSGSSVDFTGATVTGLNIGVGNLIGDVTGNLFGDVTGNLFGDVTGNLFGDVCGNVYADNVFEKTSSAGTTFNNNIIIDKQLIYSGELIASTGAPVVLDTSIILSEVVIDTVASTGSLANGTTIGELKTIVIKDVTSGDWTLTPATSLCGTSYTFDTKGQSVMLIWTSSGWAHIGGAGAFLNP